MSESSESPPTVNPAYAPPWHGLAVIDYLMGNFALLLPKAAYAQSRKAILKALELDETLPEAHGHLAALSACEFDWEGAEREFRIALELGPENSDVWFQYTFFFLSPMRRMDEAIAAMKKALELDPLSPVYQARLGFQFLAIGQYEQALKQIQNALELDPLFTLAHIWLGITYILEEKFAEGLHAIEVANQSFGSNPLLLGFLGFIHARMGQTAEAQRLLEELNRLMEKSYVPGTTIAMIYLGLGKMDKAFDWFEKGVEERHSMISTGFSLPIFDPLRSHPRYKALLRKMNLEP